MTEFFRTKPSRRSFLAGAGAVSATALIAGCNDSTANTGPSTGAGPTGITYPALDFQDNDILNFALNLEYLEAEFYLRAATGSGVPTADALSGAGAVTAGGPVTGLSSTVQGILYGIAQDELNHIRAIQATINGNSGTAVARPAIDLTNGFNMLASAAGIGGTFDPFSSPQAFLVGAFTFEVGVTAYNGAAPLISSTAILDAAAGIAAVEAYHYASIRTLLEADATQRGDQTYVGYANLISALRAKLGNGKETPLSISSIVSADPTTAVGFARSTDEVLHIVYGKTGSGVTGGGFFPNGLNGTISTTTS